MDVLTFATAFLATTARMDTSLWDAYRTTVARFPDLDALRWKNREGWTCLTWRGLDRTIGSADGAEGVASYLAALGRGAPAALLSAGELSQRDALDETRRLGERLGLGARDRALALAPAFSGPWLRALWLGLVHGCAVHLGGPAVLDEVRPTVVIDQEEGSRCASNAST